MRPSTERAFVIVAFVACTPDCIVEQTIAIALPIRTAAPATPPTAVTATKTGTVVTIRVS